MEPITMPTKQQPQQDAQGPADEPADIPRQGADEAERHQQDKQQGAENREARLARPSCACGTGFSFRFRVVLILLLRSRTGSAPRARGGVSCREEPLREFLVLRVGPGDWPDRDLPAANRDRTDGAQAFFCVPFGDGKPPHRPGCVPARSRHFVSVICRLNPSVREFYHKQPEWSKQKMERHVAILRQIRTGLNVYMVGYVLSFDYR